MNKSVKNGSPTLPDGKKILPLSKDEVKALVKRDLEVAGFTIRMCLRYPDVLERFSSEMYDRVMAEEEAKRVENPESMKDGRG